MAAPRSSLAEDVLDVLEIDRPARSKKTTGDDTLRAAVRKGLPFGAFQSVLDRLEISQAAMASVLGIPSRTLARRQAGRALRPDESDRLYRVAKTVAHAQSVFGAELTARHWLKTPNRALGGETPLSLLDTDIGTRRVEEVLERIDQGVFS